MTYVSFVELFSDECDDYHCKKPTSYSYFTFNTKENCFYFYNRCISHKRNIRDEYDEVISSRYILKILKDFIKKNKEFEIRGKSKIANASINQIIEHVEHKHE